MWVPKLTHGVFMNFNTSSSSHTDTVFEINDENK